MKIFSVNFSNPYINKTSFIRKSGFINFGNDIPVVDNKLEQDTFVKSPMEVETTAPVGKVIFSNYEFEHKFSHQFFKKLAAEGITDPYDGKIIIPPQDVDTLKNLGVLSKKSPIAIKFLKDYKESMYPIEKEVFSMLESLSKKYPNKNIQELIQLKYNKAEQVLIKQQTIILDKIGMIARKLPKDEFKATRKLINDSFDRIMDPNPALEERFSRKRFLAALRELPISDENTKAKLYQIASELPTSDKSINAFIVKYSQTEKLVTNKKNGKTTKIPRGPEDLGLRLIEPSILTDDHIYAQKYYRLEELARQAGDTKSMNLSQQRITIPSTRRMNGEKSDMLLDEFIIKLKNEPITNTYRAIERYCRIADIWANQKKYKDAVLLIEYIELLKEEFARRSNLIEIDLSEHEKTFNKIRKEAAEYEENIKQKRLKKCGHADNSHKENYVDKNGVVLKNRKVQKHGARFDG